MISNWKPNILFSPSLGQGLGLGNLLRCLSISSVLDNSVNSIFCLPANRSDLQIFLNKYNCRTSEMPLEESAGSCDVIVFDHQGPIHASSTFEKVRQKAPKVSIIAMDYFYRDHVDIDVLINLSGFHETDWPGGLVHCEYNEGLDYAIIRPEFQILRPSEPKFNKSVRNVLITFGGEDSANWTHKAVHWLERYVGDKLYVQIILGALNKSRPEIEKFKRNKTRHEYNISSHVFDIEMYMHQADIVFCGGGTTIMELAFLGKPVIALPQNEMERAFLKDFEKHGYLLSGSEGCLREMNEEPVKRLFTDPLLRVGMAKIGLKIVDGKGLLRIADIILKRAYSYNEQRPDKLSNHLAKLNKR